MPTRPSTLTVIAIGVAVMVAACTRGDPSPVDATGDVAAEPPAESVPEDVPETSDDVGDAVEDLEQEQEEVAVQRRAADLPDERTEVTGTVWDGRIIAVGGLDDSGGAMANVDLYDPLADVWSRGPDLPVPLHHTAVATLGDRVYVVGGYSIQAGAWVAEPAVWSLGPDEDAWRQEPPLTTPRGALAVASTGDRLVAVGGVAGGRQVLTSTEVLEAGADAWAPGPELQTPREHLAATAVGDAVYAIAGRVGGFDTNHATVEVLRGDRWEPAAPLEASRGGIGAATVVGVPCVAGGEEPAGTIATIECLLDDGWEVVAELEVPRHGLVVAALGDELHVVGGGPEPGLTVSGVHEVVPVSGP